MTTSSYNYLIWWVGYRLNGLIVEKWRAQTNLFRQFLNSPFSSSGNKKEKREMTLGAYARSQKPEAHISYRRPIINMIKSNNAG